MKKPAGVSPVSTTSASITPLIIEFERVIAEAIRHFGLSVPAESITVTIASKGRMQAVGWFGRDFWRKGQEKRHEINMSAEHITTHHMGELAIHELAHAENAHLGIKDCAGRKHNKKFKSMAERLGLVVKPRDSAVGYGYTELGPDAEAFLNGMSFNRQLFSTARLTGGAGKKKDGVRQLKIVCDDCEAIARMSRKTIDEVGLPTCACGGQFNEAD